jgi:hypothetical protein
MLAGLYGYVSYGDIEGISGDEFAEHVSLVLFGVCTWLASLKRDGDFYEGNLLVRMDGDCSKTKWDELSAVGKEAFALEIGPSGDRVELAGWLARKQRLLVSGEDVRTFGRLYLGEEILSVRPRFTVCTECRPDSLYVKRRSNSPWSSGAGLTVEVFCSEAFWVILEEWDKYAEWGPKGGRILDFRGANGPKLLKEFVDKWSVACIWLACN